MTQSEIENSDDDLRMRLPSAWRSTFDAHSLQRVESFGETSAVLLKVAFTNGSPAEYIKLAQGADAEQLRQEIACLGWLNHLRCAQTVRTPQVLATFDDLSAPAKHVALRMSAVRGTPASALASRDPAWIVTASAQALATLHLLPIESCAFDQTITARLAEANRRIASGLVDSDDFDSERRDADPATLLVDVEAMARILRSEPADLVVTHGDANLSNLLLDEVTGEAASSIAGASAVLTVTWI